MKKLYQLVILWSEYPDIEKTIYNSKLYLSRASCKHRCITDEIIPISASINRRLQDSSDEPIGDAYDDYEFLESFKNDDLDTVNIVVQVHKWLTSPSEHYLHYGNADLFDKRIFAWRVKEYEVAGY